MSLTTSFYVGLILLMAGCVEGSPGHSVASVGVDATTADAGTDRGPFLDDTSDDFAESDGDALDADVTDTLITDAADADAQEDTATDSGADVVLDTEPDTDESDADEGDGGVDADEPLISELCFADIFEEDAFGPQYDRFEPAVGDHCAGTNHQDITGVEQVVFFGDSVTQGTPNDDHLLCIDNEHFYRNLLADWLAEHFQLDKGDPVEWGQWRTYSCAYNGEPGLQRSGDFKNCAKWGGRTDDFLGDVHCQQRDPEDREYCCQTCCAGGECADGGACPRGANQLRDDEVCGIARDKQIFRCLPDGGSDRRTLFVFTMGGNDIAKIAQEGAEIDPETPEGQAEIDAGYPSVWALAYRTIAYLEQAVAFLKDPQRFPSGSFVVFGNPFEFTDGTGQVSACSPDNINIPGIGELDISALGLNLAELGGFGEWARPEIQEEIVVWVLEEYMRVAVEYQADLVWMLEHFCGHGFVATGPEADTENRCYREDDPSVWFDITCIHPNDAGHHAIYSLFRDVIQE